MILRADEKKTQVWSEGDKPGVGEIPLKKWVPEQGLPPHWRFLGEMYIEPGQSWGTHTHKGESEIYYVLQGEAILTVEGKTGIAKKGDLSILYDGQSHCVENRGSEQLILLCCIVTTR